MLVSSDPRIASAMTSDASALTLLNQLHLEVAHTQDAYVPERQPRAVRRDLRIAYRAPQGGDAAAVGDFLALGAIPSGPVIHADIEHSDAFGRCCDDDLEHPQESG
jgi:hypothetical protein